MDDGVGGPVSGAVVLGLAVLAFLFGVGVGWVCAVLSIGSRIGDAIGGGLR